MRQWAAEQRRVGALTRCTSRNGSDTMEMRKARDAATKAKQKGLKFNQGRLSWRTWREGRPDASHPSLASFKREREAFLKLTSLFFWAFCRALFEWQNVIRFLSALLFFVHCVYSHCALRITFASWALVFPLSIACTHLAQVDSVRTHFNDVVSHFLMHVRTRVAFIVMSYRRWFDVFWPSEAYDLILRFHSCIVP